MTYYLATRHRGFTLLEVLIATFILSLVITACARVTGQSSHHLAISEERHLAQLFIHNRLAEIQLNSTDRDVSNSNGQLQLLGQLFHWQQQVSTTPRPDFQRIEMQVRTSQGDVRADITALLFTPESANE